MCVSRCVVECCSVLQCVLDNMGEKISRPYDLMCVSISISISVSVSVSISVSVSNSVFISVSVSVSVPVPVCVCVFVCVNVCACMCVRVCSCYAAPTWNEAISSWVLCHFTRVLNWFAIDTSARSASSFKVICGMSILIISYAAPTWNETSSFQTPPRTNQPRPPRNMTTLHLVQRRMDSLIIRAPIYSAEWGMLQCVAVCCSALQCRMDLLIIRSPINS